MGPAIIPCAYRGNRAYVVSGASGSPLLGHRRLEDQPIRTYYSLTDRGEALADVFEAFEVWAAEWTDAPAPTPQFPD